MINTTDNIVILENNEAILIQELRNSLLEVRTLIIKENNFEEIPEKLLSNTKHFAFIYHFSEDKIRNLVLDKGFIENLLEYTEEKDGNNICVTYGFVPSNILLQNYYLRVGLKLTLLSLWKKLLLLLPIRFQTGDIGVINLENKFTNNLTSYFRNYFDNKNKEQFSKDFLATFPPKILRVIRTTNYQDFNDVNIEELNNLHIAILDAQSGRSNINIPKGNFYIEFFLNEILNNNAKFNFNPIEYRQWAIGFYKRFQRFNYIDYQNKKEDLKEYRKEYNLKDTKKRIAIKKGIENPNYNDNCLEEEFFRILKINKTWNKTVPIYPGYENFDNYNSSRIWVKVYNSFINQRIKNGYETTKTQLTIFNFLMDYIFFYLNAWNTDNKNKVNLPLSPKDFKRVLYIKPQYEDFNRPLTLIELLEHKDRSNNFKNRVLFNLEMFFAYVADIYEDEQDIWNKEIKNPIRKSDYFIERKNKKTNKIIIPKKIYSYLKKYLSSLENFGEYLIQKYSNEKLDNVKNIINKQHLACEDFGYVPFIVIDNKTIPIKDVPNLYQWRLRTFDKNKINNLNKEEDILTQWIPSNTLLRTFILPLNTGLRSAQVLWLDMRTWDSLNDINTQQTYYKLNINTDKFKNEDWTTFISHQMRTSLLKETNFQKSMKEDFMSLCSNYKSREHTRFSDILPLFRLDSKDGNPIPYESFNANWKELLMSFQNWLNYNINEHYDLAYLEKPKTIKIEGTENKYCPLIINAIHTPHSMRATFCTHMAEYLERSEIAELVGHASDLVTSEVYIKPEESVLKEKISKAIDILDNGVNASYFEKNSSAHIKPNLINSSLQKAFSQNREQTIELFNITSISLNINKESEEQSQKAIKLLKDARMDQVVFEPTHICPVGGMCPQEVMNIIAEKRRCGLCPLALKCVDNLNPIYAKQRDLMREIKNGKETLDIAIKEKESEISISKIEEKVNLDIRELVSWKFSAEVLSSVYEDMKENKQLDKIFYVEMPDMVKNHLTKVSVSNEKEYILTRLADANSYPQFNNPENKYRAELLRKDIIRNLNLIDYEDLNITESQKIEVFCAMIKNMLESNQIGLNKLVEYDCFKTIEQQKGKQDKLFNNKQILLLK
jgi:hypothetical protein